jgi:hypothetical protein
MPSASATTRRAGTAGNTQTRDAPSYEQPLFALNPAAQRSLAQISRNRNLSQLQKNLKDAQKCLADTAVEINDRLIVRENALEKHKQRQALNTDGNENAAISESTPIQESTARLTERMDETIRRIIDAQQSIDAVGASLRHTVDATQQDPSTQAGTQASRVTRRAAHASTEDRSEEVDASEMQGSFQDFTPTDPAGGTQAIRPPLHIFRERVEKDQILYQRQTLTERYAENNDYREFRRIVHDAQHPDDDVPMPHHTEWFSEAVAPPPGVTASAAAGDEQDDDDDDIAISRATISTKCPLTLVEFVEPLTSTKCPHSFESEAVLGMIRQSPTKTIQCPVSGCRESLREKDLHVDVVLKRKIERLQRAKHMDDDDDDETDNAGREGGAGNASQRTVHVIDEFDIDDMDTREDTQSLPKNEPRSTRGWD